MNDEKTTDKSEPTVAEMRRNAVKNLKQLRQAALSAVNYGRESVLLWHEMIEARGDPDASANAPTHYPLLDEFARTNALSIPEAIVMVRAQQLATRKHSADVLRVHRLAMYEMDRAQSKEALERAFSDAINTMPGVSVREETPDLEAS